MKILIRFIIFLILFIMFIYINDHYSSNVILPFATLILVLLSLFENRRFRENLKKGKILKLGTSDFGKTKLIISIILGLVIFFIGFSKLGSDLMYLGINLYSYIGIYILSTSFLDNESYLVLFGNKGVCFKDINLKLEIKYKKIDHIRIHDQKILIKVRKKVIDILIDDNCQKNRIIEYLKPKIEDKLIIE